MRTLPTIFAAAISSSLFTALALPLLTGSPVVADEHEQHTAIAVCDLAAITTEVISSDRYAPIVQARVDENNATMAAFETRRAELEQRYTEAQENGDQQLAQQILQEFEGLRAEATAIQQRLAEEMAQMQVRHFREAYKLVRDAANAIGEEMGYDYVAVNATFQDDLSEALEREPVIEILGRPFVRFPEGVDITEDVRADLNL